DRVAAAPHLLVRLGPVAGRVVGGGVRTHPVGHCLDEGGPAAAAGAFERLGGHRVAGEHVVAIHPYRGDAETATHVGLSDPGLARGGFGDRPVVVLAEEHHRGVVDGGEGQCLVQVTLGSGTVAEVGDHGTVPVRVAGADVAVALDAHRVPGGVQRVRADHQG